MMSWALSTYEGLMLRLQWSADLKVKAPSLSTWPSICVASCCDRRPASKIQHQELLTTIVQSPQQTFLGAPVVDDLLELPCSNFGGKVSIATCLQSVAPKVLRLAPFGALEELAPCGEGCMVLLARSQHTVQGIADGAGFTFVLKT